MRLAIIGTDGLPARYGGFETFAMEVSPRIAALGHEVMVVGSSIGRAAGEKVPDGVSVRNLPLRANGAASIPFDLASFATVCRWADAIVLLGVSAGPFVPLMQRLTRRGRLVVNVDGLESRRAKWSSLGRRYLAMSEMIAIRGAHHVVADNRAIADIISRTHGRASSIVAYGNDHVLPINDSACRVILEKNFGLVYRDYLFTVARIEPENNIDMMLEAAAAQSVFPYAILGNFSASRYGRELLERYRDHPMIHFISANYDPITLAALRSGCRAYLHGHSVGGTNPSLVEILPYGRPILSYDCSFNRHTLDDSGAYFDTMQRLHELLAESDFERHAPPAVLRSDPRYQWQAIAENYAALAFED